MPGRKHLTVGEIAAIKDLYDAGEKLENIAKEFNTTKQTVHNHVRGKVKGTGRTGRSPHWCPRVMTKAMYQELGMNPSEIAELLGVHKATVWQHCNKVLVKPQKLDERFEDLFNRMMALGAERRAIIEAMRGMKPNGDQD